MKHILSLVLLWLHISAFGESIPKSETTAFRMSDTGQILSLAGSNTIGAELAPALAQAFLEAKGATSVKILTTGENEYRVSGRNRERSVYIDIRAHGSSTGFTGLENGVDIAMSSRQIKDSEANRLKELGDLREFSSEHVVAIDGLAVIVHQDNPIHTLSVAQVAQIFSGQIDNWRELGGPDLTVRLLARDNKSGTWDTFKSLVLSKQFPLQANAERYESNDELSDQVSQDPSAIGFVGLASVRHAKPLAVIDGGTTALKPTPLFVATEDYPLARRLFLYTPATPTTEFVGEFIDFAQAESGQSIVEHIGFVSQNPIGIKVATDGGSPFYQTLTRHAKRLSMNFRFQPRQAELDNKAKRDVMRLAEFLKTPTNQDLHIQLIGFSDQEQKPSLANVLSKLRASAVKRELFRHGVQTEAIEGFGASRPIASVSAKNDRVEVWVYSPENALAIQKERQRQETRLEASAQQGNFLSRGFY